MPKSIEKQLEHAVCECFTPRHDKRADKFNDAIDTSWKIYSVNHRKSMMNLVKDFGKFMKENHSECKFAYQIDQNVIQDYFSKKAETCVDKTLYKYSSNLWKLEICCKRIFKQSTFNWGVKSVRMPESKKDVDIKKDTPVPIEVSRKIIEGMCEKRSEVYNAVRLSTYTGMRVEETTCVTKERIRFTGGEFGYGWVEIPRGPEGGAKGGRPRTIPIMDIETQQALKKAVEDKNSKDYVVESRKGGQMTTANAHNRLREWMNPQYGNQYKGNRYHGMRKEWAQRYYDTVRNNGCTRKQAISKTNQVLGHGSDRGMSGIKSYVANAW